MHRRQQQNLPHAVRWVSPRFASSWALPRFCRTWRGRVVHRRLPAHLAAAEIAIVAGVVIILMGLNFLGLLRLSFLSREARFQARNAPASPLGAYIMGLAFAFGWTPCIGPVLGPILTLAGGSSTVGEGALLLATYSLGLGIPFLIAALFPAHSCAFFRASGCIWARLKKPWACFSSLRASCPDRRHAILLVLAA